jgi:hypothetical protein
MMKLEVHIPNDLEAFVRSVGADMPDFADPNELVVEALYRLKDEYDLYCLKRERLRDELRHSAEQAERGELIDSPTFMRQLRERLQAPARC